LPAKRITLDVERTFLVAHRCFEGDKSDTFLVERASLRASVEPFFAQAVAVRAKSIDEHTHSVSVFEKSIPLRAR
jgi:hypothetical protein